MHWYIHFSCSSIYSFIQYYFVVIFSHYLDFPSSFYIKHVSLSHPFILIYFIHQCRTYISVAIIFIHLLVYHHGLELTTCFYTFDHHNLYVSRLFHLYLYTVAVIGNWWSTKTKSIGVTKGIIFAYWQEVELGYISHIVLNYFDSTSPYQALDIFIAS